MPGDGPAAAAAPGAPGVAASRAGILPRVQADPLHPVPPGGVAALGERLRAGGRRVVLCHGCFDGLHAGHAGYLEAAAARGDVLVASVTSDDAVEKADGTRPHLPEERRAAELAALPCVDHVVVCAAETGLPVIERLRPDLYAKGREYAGSWDPRLLAERAAVEAAGGRVLFVSGPVVMSSTAILAADADAGGGDRERLRAAARRWGLTRARVSRLLGGFAGLRVVVVGDALEDRYLLPGAAGSAARTLRFPGGAAAAACHAAALGASATLVSPAGADPASHALDARLRAAGVEPVLLPLRPDLPVKERVFVRGREVRKATRGGAAGPDPARERRLREAAAGAVGGGVDAVVLADFGFGCLRAAALSPLLETLRPACRVLSGDVSGPRETLTAMRGADLLCPTGVELRAACGAPDAPLPDLAAGLTRRLGVHHLLATLDARGAVLFHPRDPRPGHWFEHRSRADHLPSLAGRVVDPVGAGDALLAAATLTLAAGGTGLEAAYVGSLAAAVAVGRLGNAAVCVEALRAAVDARPELRPAAAQASGAAAAVASAG